MRYAGLEPVARPIAFGAAMTIAGESAAICSSFEASWPPTSRLRMRSAAGRDKMSGIPKLESDMPSRESARRE